MASGEGRSITMPQGLRPYARGQILSNAEAVRPESPLRGEKDGPEVSAGPGQEQYL